MLKGYKCLAMVMGVLMVFCSAAFGEDSSKAQVLTTPQVHSALSDKANVADLPSMSGAASIGFSQNGAGGVVRTVLDKMRESVSVYDFGAKCDGSTDDSAKFQRGANAVSAAGGGTLRIPSGKCYLATTVVIPPNVSLVGPLKSVGGQPSTGQNFNAVSGTIYLAPTATLQLSDSTSVSGLQIMAANLRGALPYANAAAAQAGVNAFAGTALTLRGSDINLHHLIILGFNTAIKSNDGVANYYRQKFEWIDIDSTNGIDIYKSADIGRIAHVHAWNFLTFNVGLGNHSLRSGTAFKVASNFDEGKFFDNFAFGYAVGFDIGALIDVTLLDCGVDSWAANPKNPGQIGVKVSGAVTQVKIIGGAYSAVDKAVYMSSTGSLIVTGGAQFFGNKTHIYATSGRLSITGNSFNYGNARWSGTTAIEISGVSSPPLIANNVFDTIRHAYVFPTGAGSPTEQAIIWGNQYNNGASDPFVGERLVTQSGVATKTITNYVDSPVGQQLVLRKSRGTIASPTAVNSGDVVASVSGSAWNGATWSPVAQMRYQTVGTQSNRASPGSIIFSTTPAGSTTLIDNVALNGSYLYPTTDNVTALGGGPSIRWSALYAVTAYVSNVEASGNVLVKSTGGLGYGSGAGGIVTQSISKTTGVMLNRPAGKITLNNAALAAAATACFTLTNSAIASTDTLIVNLSSGNTAGAYTTQVDSVTSGSANICLTNRSAGRLSEAVVLNFSVIKGSAN